MGILIMQSNYFAISRPFLLKTTFSFFQFFKSWNLKAKTSKSWRLFKIEYIYTRNIENSHIGWVNEHIKRSSRLYKLKNMHLNVTLVSNAKHSWRKQIKLNHHTLRPTASCVVWRKHTAKMWKLTLRDVVDQQDSETSLKINLILWMRPLCDRKQRNTAFL